MTSNDVYKKLAMHLNSLAMGYPPSEDLEVILKESARRASSRRRVFSGSHISISLIPSILALILGTVLSPVHSNSTVNSSPGLSKSKVRMIVGRGL